VITNKNPLSKDKEHDYLLRELREKIYSLGLGMLRRTGVFHEEYIPDILTKVGAGDDDYVAIEVINDNKRMKHDIAGLIYLDENVKKAGISCRGLIAVVTKNITNTKCVGPLTSKTPNFILIRASEFEDILKLLMVASAKNTLDRLGYITRYVLPKDGSGSV
jgi:hypothetical protein